MPSASFVARVPGVMVLGTLFACGGEPTAPVPAVPTAITATSTATLSGTVGTVLATPITVRVTDADGEPVSGVAVDFRVTAGGGSVAPAATQSSLRVAGSTLAASIDSTGADGEAAMTWTLGPTAGEQTVTASVIDLGTVTFSATAAPGAPAALDVLRSSPLAGLKGGPAHSPIAVAVADQFGNRVSGATLTWSALTPGATVGSSSVVTDTAGEASVSVTLGPNQNVDLFRVSGAGIGVDTIGVVALDGIEDPAGDAGAAGGASLRSPDITFMGAAVLDSLLWLYFEFAEPVDPVLASGTQPQGAVVGRFELDLDQDSTTGFLPIRSCSSIADTIPFGVDAIGDLDPRIVASVNPPFPNEIPGAVLWGVRDTTNTDRCGHVYLVGRTVPFYVERALLILLPFGSADIDDDGVMNITAFGASPTATAAVITDLVPDVAFYSFPGPDVPLAQRVRASDIDAPTDRWRFLVAPRGDRPVELFETVRYRVALPHGR